MANVAYFQKPGFYRSFCIFTEILPEKAKGTKGAKRLLKRLSGRERRYQSWVNHNISKQIVRRAKDTQSIIALEDLTGIRERTNRQPRTKTERRRSNSWAFYQLRLFIDYKAIKEGVEVVRVPPAYTSQTCHNCLHIHPQKGKSYRSGIPPTPLSKGGWGDLRVERGC
ncbi:RNA-guided endonuclease TnpB family protein [Baaleninema sp.]|uniref:RNA-guided endonuclease TnpB family protein n=1 Tax=Baaleninema sp. TaxID=3101197 RepID=UPI003D0305D8